MPTYRFKHSRLCDLTIMEAISYRSLDRSNYFNM